MDLKRYFRGPFVAVLVMLLVFFVVYEYASSGNSYTQTDTSRVVSLIEKGDVSVGPRLLGNPFGAWS